MYRTYCVLAVVACSFPSGYGYVDNGILHRRTTSAMSPFSISKSAFSRSISSLDAKSPFSGEGSNGPFSRTDDLRQSLKNPNPNMPTEMQTKLLAETIAPWRNVRLFLYGSCGLGALISLLLTVATFAAGASGVRNDVDLHETGINLAVDLAGVVAFSVFAKLDLDKGKELNDKVDAKLNSSSAAIDEETMTKREQALRNLKVSLYLGDKENEEEVSVGDVMSKGKQNVVVVSGPRKFVRDCLLSARVDESPFAKGDVLIVPLYDDVLVSSGSVSDGGGGFGKGSAEKNRRPYIALPDVGSGWASLIEQELTDATAQGNGAKAKKEGIVLACNKEGKVIRRGLGLPDWPSLIELFKK